MAIKVSGTTVIDDSRNISANTITATSIDVPPSVLTFSPADASSGALIGTNIVLTFDAIVTKGTGNILLKSGSAGGDTLQTIDVTSGNVTISGAEVTINPPSDLPTGIDVYVVVPEDAFKNSALNSGNDVINTYNFTTGPILATAFSPADAATGVLVGSNIVITFSENIAKGSGNILIRNGSASGTIQQTIDVTSGNVSVSGNQATINPPSDLTNEIDTYIVVGSGCFLNADEVALSGNAEINTYNFTTEDAIPPLGNNFEGGQLVCCSSNNLWIIAPSAAEVVRNWYQRSHAYGCAQSVTGCSGWFTPDCSQLKNPGYQCRTYWDNYANNYYWSNSQRTAYDAWAMSFYDGSMHSSYKCRCDCIRAFRCVSYTP